MHIVTVFLGLKFASSGDPITWTVYCVLSVKEYISTTHTNPSCKGLLKLVLGTLHWLVYLHIAHRIPPTIGQSQLCNIQDYSRILGGVTHKPPVI